MLKDRVFAGDLWELIGERIIEAKQEETLQRHQSVCTRGDGRRHAAVEQILLEKKKKRCCLYFFPQASGFSSAMAWTHVSVSYLCLR